MNTLILWQILSGVISIGLAMIWPPYYPQCWLPKLKPGESCAFRDPCNPDPCEQYGGVCRTNCRDHCCGMKQPPYPTCPIPPLFPGQSCAFRDPCSDPDPCQKFGKKCQTNCLDYCCVAATSKNPIEI